MSPAQSSLSPYDAISRREVNSWLIAATVSIAAFMEFLDTSIANVALPYMAGNLGASNDESTWVLTSYLVSNAIVLPISGWLAARLGRKRFFAACLASFTVSSLLCGFAPSLSLLLAFRVMQGAGGGGLQPMAQAILADAFPPQQRGPAFAVYGITAVLAPTIGPTVGGWITFSYSWRWIFFINLPVGLLALILVTRLIEDPPYLSRLKTSGVTLDYIGMALLAVGVGALQVLLDKGQEDDWFGSRFIVTLAIVATVCLVALVVWESFRADPIIDVQLFRNFNYLTSNVMMFTLGILLFSSVVILPQFLQTLVGYTAELAGLVLSGGGVVLLVAMPIVGYLATKVQARYIIALGWLCLALSMYYATRQVDLLMSFRTAALLRIVQVVGVALLFVPITLMSYVGMPVEKSNAIAGMINFMRNIGSSVGTSAVTTVIARRSQFHQSILVGHTALGSPTFRNALDVLSARLDQFGMNLRDAHVHALARLYRDLQAQATTLAYVDTYWLLGTSATIMCALSFLLKKNDPRAGGEAAPA